ncbi:MAG: hypothetical protein JNL21_32625 [Myxococcales bacterium]|nr:hypothetical protein [Myxococcales bacterium]
MSRLFPLGLLLLSIPTACAPTARQDARPEPSSSPLSPAVSVTPPEATVAPQPSASAVPPAASVAPAEVAPEGFEPIPAKRKGGFPGVAFKKARAFAFDLSVSGKPVCRAPLDPDGTLCSTVERDGVELSAAQVERLLALLGQPSTFGGGAKCFLPHHGVVFYDERETPVAELSFCLLCDMALAHPAIPRTRPSDTGEGLTGLSEKGNAALRGLCNELGLPKCNARSPQEFGAPE